MKLSRPSTVVYLSAVVLLIIAIGSVFNYATSPYHGVVNVTFHVQVIAYKEDGGDYAFVTFDLLVINFSRTMPQRVSNQTTEVASYLGQLSKPLNLSLNLTMTSSTHHLTLPTNNITFTTPGFYAVTLDYQLHDIIRDTYLVNLTYTDNIHETYQIWSTVIYSFEVN